MAAGDIAGTIETLEFCTTDAVRPFVLHITGEIFAITYTDASNHGVVASIGIDAAGDIEPTIIDSLVFDSGAAHFSTIVHVSGAIYAIAYRGVDNDGWVCTVDIAANGVIANAVVDTLEFEAGSCYEPNLIHHIGTTFAVVYRNAANHGTLTTFSISAAGDIGAAPIDSDTFIASHGNNPIITNVFENIFATCYRTGAYAGGLATHSIHPNGTITDPAVDVETFVAGFVGEPFICNATGNIYAIVYRCTDDDGSLSTISISDTGTIGAGAIDTLEFETDNTVYPYIIAINAGMCAIAATGPGSSGWIHTVQISDAGDITDPLLDSFEFNPSEGSNPKLIIVDGDIFVVSYSGPGTDGYIQTIGIERPNGARTLHLAVLGVG